MLKCSTEQSWYIIEALCAFNNVQCGFYTAFQTNFPLPLDLHADEFECVYVCMKLIN